jgi:hypothetical protein
MKVSMDGLRNQLLMNYNSLVYKLNKRIDGEDIIDLEVDTIQRELEGIRSCIVTLAFTYMEGEDGWESMDENTHFEQFNPEEDLDEE